MDALDIAYTPMNYIAAAGSFLIGEGPTALLSKQYINNSIALVSYVDSLDRCCEVV